MAALELTMSVPLQVVVKIKGVHYGAWLIRNFNKPS